MREDMFKVIVERPRSGRSWASKSKLRYVKSEGPARMTGKRIVTLNDGRTKHLNENLAPLKRYLRKQLGRRWDDVFSEICQHLDTGSTVKMHVREHLDDFVTRKVRVDAKGGYWSVGRWDEPIAPTFWTEIYVDPLDGCLEDTAKLCRKLRIPTRKQHWQAVRLAYHSKADYAVKPLPEQRYAVQCAGIWYEVEIKGDPARRRGAANAVRVVWDAVTCPESCETSKVRVMSKKQMSKKQLRKFGLVNGAGDDYG